jgi:hypothetical protein
VNKITRLKTIPTNCRFCGADLPTAEESAHRPGPVAYYCTPTRVRQDDGTVKRIPSACERARAALKALESIDPMFLTPAAAEEAARQVNAWRMRLVRTQAAATRHADMAAAAK